jgi:hypothetical protein
MSSKLISRFGFHFPITALLVLLIAVAVLGAAGSPAATTPAWSMNATIIEACSCPMFCQCYFNTKPAGHEGHGAHAFCRFNNAFKVNKGAYGNTKLDGAKFWVAGDLGGDFSMGKMDWAVLTFDPSVKKEQRDGIAAILGHLYPVKWNSFNIAKDAGMEWNYTRERAVARLNGGKTAEVVLHKAAGMTADPVVIRNLKYWGAPRNDGFVMMPNEVEAYRAGSKAFEFKGTNGFMITFDIASTDIH